MKTRLNRILNRILNLKFILTIIATALFATELRLIYFKVLELNLSLDQLDMTNLSFFFLVVLFRSVLSIVLEELWPYFLPLDAGDGRYKTALLMEDKSPKSSQANPESSKVKPNVIELLGISKEASKTLSDMFYTLRDLEKLKEAKNIGVFESKEGGLDIDVPRNMSNKEAEEISDKVFSLDAKYNDGLDHYKKLLENEKKYEDDLIDKNYKKLYQEVLKKHGEVYKDK